MNNRFLGFNYVPSIFVGTVAALVIVQPAIAKTAKEVAQIAIPTTVQINNIVAPNLGGSGVIISKKGKTYTVLTANHVVTNPNSEYVIRTSKGKEYKVTAVKGFRNNESGPDLAVVMFESEEEYSVAPISNSDEATIGSGVYISGYPVASVGINERRYSFTSGIITTEGISDSKGYTLRYDAVTDKGMSGGPVFDVSGRVIGIHGAGEAKGSIVVEKSQSDGQSEKGQADVKTGFNLAIPINTFVSMMSQVGMEKSDCKMDNKAPENVDVETVDDAQVNNWFDNFAQDLIQDVIRNEVQRGLRRILPF
jgi:S1-C subfamily serine protease